MGHLYPRQLLVKVQGGDLIVRASESVEAIGTGFEDYQETIVIGTFNGTITPSDLGTGLITATTDLGTSGDITIETPFLFLTEGAFVFSPAFGNGTGGDIQVVSF